MSALGDPADKVLDAAADGAFGGKHDAVNRRAGYTDPLGWALKQARKGGTLAAGEGLLIIKHYEALVRGAYSEGWHDQFSERAGAYHATAIGKAAVAEMEGEGWEDSDARKALEGA